MNKTSIANMDLIFETQISTYKLVNISTLIYRTNDHPNFSPPGVNSRLNKIFIHFRKRK